MLSNGAIAEYQGIYERAYKHPISFADAKIQGERLLRLFGLLYRPIPKPLAEGKEIRNEKYGNNQTNNSK